MSETVYKTKKNDEIDLIELALKFWDQRRMVI